MLISINGTKTEISDKGLEALKKEFHEHAQTYTSAVTCGGTAKLTGEYTRQGTACHSWVTSAFSNYQNKFGTTFLVCTASTEKRSAKVCKPESLNALKAWLVSDKSPFSKYIVNKDDAESLKDGFIILCGVGGASYAESLWICKALRYGVEGAGALDVWKFLYDGGVNPVLALAVATEVRLVRGTTFGYTGPEYHSAIFGYTTAIPVEGIIRGDIAKTSNSTQGLFNTGKGKVLDKGVFSKKMEGFCLTQKVSDGWGGFVSGKSADRDEFLKNVLAFQKEWEDNVPEQERWNYGNPLGQSDSVVTPDRTPTASTVYLDIDL